jgi:hypothetical protein
MAEAKTTTDHEEIRRWVEERGGWPARVIGTGGDEDPGLLRIDYPGYSGEGKLERISWEEWFEKFDEKDLAFIYQDEGDSRFSKLVSRQGSEGGEGGGGNR